MVAKKKHHLSEYIPRDWKASVRDTALLLNEFRGPVSFFAITILGLGTLYFFWAIELKEPVGSWAEAVYLMLTLTFLQPSGNFPTSPFLQSFFFLMPLVGVGTLAQGLADFGILLFNRRSRTKEWEMAVASTFNHHTVLVGLGHLGYRVASKLYEMNESVVAIELNPSADLFTSVQTMGIPVIQADGTNPAALEAAGIARAKTIILCSQNDSINLQIALKARSFNPKIQVVVRIFDEDFARALHDQFGFTALSATEMAAPVFAAAAAGMDVTNPISVEGQQLSLGRMTINSGSILAGQTVGFVEDNYHLNVVLVRYDHHSEMHPTDSRILASGDMIAILGGPEQLSHLMHDNEV
jgi:Trk K+ transport system NAD-binding subunit